MQNEIVSAEHLLPTIAFDNIEQAVAALDAPNDPAARAKFDRIVVLLRKSIDFSNRASLIGFGSKAPERIETLARSMVRSSVGGNMTDNGQGLLQLTRAIDGMGTDSLMEPRGYSGAAVVRRIMRMIKGIAWDLRNQVARLRVEWSNVEGQIDAIKAKLEDQAREMKRSLVALDQMVEANAQQFLMLAVFIEAARQEIEHQHNVVIADRRNRLEALTDIERDAERRRIDELESAVDLLDKTRLALVQSKAISLAMLPTIRDMRRNGETFLSDVQMQIAHGIPALTIAIAQDIENARQAVAGESSNAMRRELAARIDTVISKTAENSKSADHAARSGILEVDKLVASMNKVRELIGQIRDREAEARRSRQASIDQIDKAAADLSTSLSQIKR